MKKSTLITTIAMIVVVVVALSTATYAWFSTSQATYANIQITTESDDNLSVMLNAENIYATGENYVAFTARDFTDDADATDQSNGIRAGLWVPNSTTALAIKPSSADGTNDCGINAAALYFAAGTINTSTSIVTIDKNIQMSPTLIHVANNMEGTQAVTLKILIGYKDDDASKYAASGVSAYVADSTGLVATTLYNLPTTAAVTTSTTYAKTEFNTTAAATAVASKPFVDSSARNHVGAITTTVAPSNAGGATADQKLAYEAGLDGYDYFYVLSVSLGDFDQMQAANYLTYVWLDAGYLNDNAKAADIKIVYAFDAKAVAQP